MQKENSDEKYMRAALEEAHKALEKDEVPIGAVIVAGDRIVARAHNLTETLNDPTAHAEMQAITSATNFLGGKYLTGCTIYVTVEPCPMCAGALAWSQISKLVYGTGDEKKGYTTISEKLLHPGTKVKKGVLENECSEIIKNFFRKKRAKSL
ncbi:MAG TPA: nucleoside deaminase [Bacteroidales bacterium]|nr:nucleoside deaminase [Bacteroidales bacterium]